MAATAGCSEHPAACCSCPGQDLGFAFVDQTLGVTLSKPKEASCHVLPSLASSSSSLRKDRGRTEGSGHCCPSCSRCSSCSSCWRCTGRWLCRLQCPRQRGRTQRERAVPPTATHGRSHLETGLEQLDTLGRQETKPTPCLSGMLFFLVTHLCLQIGPGQKHY